MARKPTGNPTGRPQNPIDWKLFEQLCGLLCTQSEIASMLGIHQDTLRDRVLEEYGEDYSSTYKKYSEVGKCSLRRNQVVLSKKNATLAIWLGKQWLGQVDTPTEVSVSADTVNQFNLLMNQLSLMQEGPKSNRKNSK